MGAPVSHCVYSTDSLIYYLLQFILPYCNTNPNYITLLGFITSNIIIYSMYNHHQKNIIYLLVFFRSIFDCLDGEVARFYKRQTHFGHKLDTFCDLYFDIIMFTFCIWIWITNPGIGYEIKFIICTIYLYCLFLSVMRDCYTNTHITILCIIDNNLCLFYQVSIYLFLSCSSEY
jgi:phosphatidylglycerophosphate synthase